MAELGRTVRVSGLPTDIEDDRLRDKLFIHFLRTKNGGGEIDSVAIDEATPDSALITFEDSEVAQRVIQHSWHILEVDGKKYELIVTEHHESLDPDKVIVSLSATVDYSQLSGGIIALTGLHRNHPDIQINYNVTKTLCTVQGAYCKVQAALAELLAQSGGSQSAEHKDSAQPATSAPKSTHTVQKHHTSEPEYSSRTPTKQREQREKANIGRPSDKRSSSSHRDLAPDGYDWDDTGQLQCRALQLPGHPTMSESEDHSLILDADMFQYLQKCCRKEYQHILSQHGVEVVDVTNQGLTTLYLQVASAVGEDGQEKERLKLASRAISKFYQENETKIRRAQLSKNILSPKGGLRRAIEKLSVRLPKLLLNEDESNVYIIGSSNDVSEAKHFFLLDHGHEERGKKEDVASLLKYPSYDSGPSTPGVEERFSLSPAGPLDVRIDQMLQSEENERRDEGARRYKLAARFKDSGLSVLGSRPGDFTVRGLSSPSRQTRPGPMLGHDVLSETTGIDGERVSSAVAQNTGGDILFKSGDALHSSASMQSKTSLNSNLMDTRPKSATALGTTQPSLSGSTTLPPVGYGSTLKRSSSFSGMPEHKAEGKGQKYQDDSGKSSVRVRGRSSSFSNQKGRDKQDVYKAEITVFTLLWHHIKEAYNMRVEDLTSDVQIKESGPQSSRDLTIIIRGAVSSKVSSCQIGLQKLIDTVHADFSVQEIHLSDLGVADPADETLQVCCTEVRNRFRKVTIQTLSNSIFLLGPKQLCSQVGASLREVFSGDLGQIPELQDLSSISTNSIYYSILNPSTHEDQSTSLQGHSNAQVTLENQTGNDFENSRSQEGRTNFRGDFYETELLNGSFRQPLVGKDPVIKEKVKMAGTVELDGQKIETFANLTTKGNDASARRVNGVGSTSTHVDKEMGLQEKETTKQGEIQDTPEESRLGQADLGPICVCGERGVSMTRTDCGVAMCFKCLDTVHIHCRVCDGKEPTPRGIQGQMSYSKLNIIVPGHNKTFAIKITYRIPDGIQGEDDPSPGKPFYGGVYEAYLPDCEKTKKLLPRLKKAFRQGLTFTVVSKETEARVTWDCIPHKTSLQGGKSGNGYPDSSYLNRLSEVLASHGIKETPAKSQE